MDPLNYIESFRHREFEDISELYVFLSGSEAAWKELASLIDISWTQVKIAKPA